MADDPFSACRKHSAGSNLCKGGSCSLVPNLGGGSQVDVFFFFFDSVDLTAQIIIRVVAHDRRIDDCAFAVSV